MKQTVFSFLGALAGGLAWMFFRSELPHLDLFVCLFCGAFFAVGLYALIFGELAVTMRGDKSPFLFGGLPARALGFLVMVASVGFFLSGFRIYGAG
jgi:hypothetical protein